MSKRNRKKGLDFERKIAEKLRPYFPLVKRHLEFQKEEAKGIDLDNTGRLRIQCKKTKSYVSINTINEIMCSREFGEIPLLVAAGDNQPAMAVLHFDDLLRILRMLQIALKGIRADEGDLI